MVQEFDLLVPQCAFLVVQSIRSDVIGSGRRRSLSIIVVRMGGDVDVWSMVGGRWRVIIHVSVESWVRHQKALAAMCATSSSDNERVSCVLDL